MEKFSLFELEKISIDDLKNQFSGIDGKNEYDFRANVALQLSKEGKLEDCPILSSNQQSRKIFHLLLSNTISDIIDNITPLFNTNARENYNFIYMYDLHGKHRIFAVYSMWVEMSVTTNFNFVSVNYPIKYDKSYLNEVKKLQTDDLFEIADSVSSANIKQQCAYHFYIELAQRVSDDPELLDNDINQPTTLISLCAYIQFLYSDSSKLEEKINDLLPTFYQELIEQTGNYDYGEDVYIETLFNINMNAETTERLYKNHSKIYLDEILSMICIAILGSGQYPKISYENFVEIIRYFLKQHEGDCNTFFKMLMGNIELGNIEQSRSYIGYIASALLQICGKDFYFSELALKGKLISHIPEGYYQ